MSEEESVLELLHKASRRAKIDDLARQDTASGIRYVMEDLESVLNESVLKHMDDVHDGHGGQA